MVALHYLKYQFDLGDEVVVIAMRNVETLLDAAHRVFERGWFCRDSW
jgi:hypothetical protein